MVEGVPPYVALDVAGAIVSCKEKSMLFEIWRFLLKNINHQLPACPMDFGNCSAWHDASTLAITAVCFCGPLQLLLPKEGIPQLPAVWPNFPWPQDSPPPSKPSPALHCPFASCANKVQAYFPTVFYSLQIWETYPVKIS